MIFPIKSPSEFEGAFLFSLNIHSKYNFLFSIASLKVHSKFTQNYISSFLFKLNSSIKNQRPRLLWGEDARASDV